MLFRALAIWFGLLLAAVLDAVVRVTWLTPAFGDSAAHVISTIVLSAVVAAAAWAAIVWLHPHTANEALLIGDEWVLLTISFEVLAGYFLIGTSWHALLMEYNLSQCAVGACPRHDVRRTCRRGVRSSPGTDGTHVFVGAKGDLRAIISHVAPAFARARLRRGLRRGRSALPARGCVAGEGGTG